MADATAEFAPALSTTLVNSTKRDLMANGAAVAARLVSGTLLFVFLGRVLGPAAFGDLMAHMAGATLLAFLANLGLNQQALREVALPSGDLLTIVGSLLTAKLALAVSVSVFALTLGLALGDQVWVFSLLCLAVVCEGVAEFFFALHKARGRYGLEAGFFTVMAAVHLLLVAGVAWASPTLPHIAMTFAASRLLQCCLAFWACHRELPFHRGTSSISAAWVQLRGGWPYAADVAISVVSTQIDTVIVRVFMGAHAAGVYQAGMRVVLGILSLSVVAGNVFVPRLTRTLGDRDAHQRTLHQLRATYLRLALAAAAGVGLLGSLLTLYGYGPAYSELWSLWPWLAALASLRILAAQHGVRLTAMGKQMSRTAINLMALGVTLAGMTCTIKLGWGLPGAIACLFVGAGFVWAVYRHRVRVLSEEHR